MSLIEYIDSNGEILSQKELVQRIEKLLNRIDTKHQSILASEVIANLDLKTLGSIYENLLTKNEQEIADNREWLFSLTDF